MPTQNAELITQLNLLLRLTATEAATARARLLQATTNDTRKELTENARNCDRRQRAIRQAVLDLGGAPDVVGIALGKAATAVKAPLEQTVPMTEVLLTDLALEHQLFDRARLVKVLAQDADADELVALAERLEDAHGNTIEWLFTVLAETAIGGPAALAPTGLQTAATTARHAATLAGSIAFTGLNKFVATTGQVTDRVTDRVADRVQGSAATVTSQVGRLNGLAGSAKKIARVGRDASLAETERQAAKDFGAQAAGSVRDVREALGAVDGADLPIKNYDRLTAKDAIAALNRLRSVDQVKVVLAYEQSNKGRQGIATAARKRISELAKSMINS